MGLPMGRTCKRWRYLRCAITPGRIQLGLDEKEAFAKVSGPQIGISEISPGEIGHAQICSAQISTNEIGPAQVGTSEVGTFEFRPDQVSTSVILLLVLEPGSCEFACAQQQSIDGLPMCSHVQLHEGGGAVAREACGLHEHVA